MMIAFDFRYRKAGRADLRLFLQRFEINGSLG